MNKLTTILSSLAIAAVGGLFFASCTSTTSPTTSSAPTNLMALSKNSTTISIEWTRASGDVSSDTIIVTNNTTGLPSAIPTLATDTKADLTVLPATVYTISVASTGGRSASINWMSANRTNNIQLYQFSSGSVSGLRLNGPGGLAVAVSAASANKAVMDFFVDDAQHDTSIHTASGISFESPQFLDVNGTPAWRKSYFQNDQNYIAGGLDNFYSATDFSTFLNTPSAGNNAYDIPDVVENDRVLTVATQDGNLAKIDIIPDAATGKLYWGTGTNKYITVNVSYQTVAGKPYAARPHAVSHGREPRNSVQ